MCRSVLFVLAAGVALAMPAAPACAQNECANAAIRAPFSGDTLQGRVPILGSARIDDFNFYKVEWAPADDPENWRAVSHTIDEPVLNGLLDEWDTTSVPDGLYRLKLTVVNGQYQEVCRISVSGLRVANYTTPTPEATPTAELDATTVPREESAEEAAVSEEAEPTATLAPIVPVGADTTTGDVLDPSTWLELFQIGEWVRAFGQGFAAGSIAGLLLLVIWAVRRPR